MVRAKLPGSGKSYVCEHLVKLGYNVLFVCPTNKLAQKYKDSGITINKFYGIGFTDNGIKGEGIIKKSFDYRWLLYTIYASEEKTSVIG